MKPVDNIQQLMSRFNKLHNATMASIQSASQSSAQLLAQQHSQINQLKAQQLWSNQMGMAHNQQNNETREAMRAFELERIELSKLDDAVVIRKLDLQEAIEFANWLRESMREPYYVDNLFEINSQENNIKIKCQSKQDAVMLKLTWG